MKVRADPSLCRDCQACTLACSLHHEGACSPALARLAVTKDMARYEFDIRMCLHCDEPECLAACPADAMFIDGRGVAIIDDDLCIECGACEEAIAIGRALTRGLAGRLTGGRSRGACPRVPFGTVT